MAESTDKKTRKIAEKRVEPGKEFESYQEAQNQLLAIQAEQQQNLALQANDAMNVQQQNQTLAQAAEVMAMDNLNPATQGILAGYGLNQPRVIKQSNTQRQGPNNITINNTTINNASGPVQGREISIRPQEAGQTKFKAWLTNVFARQDAQWQKQNQEYARRESSLTRNTNKMMRKLEGLGKEIGSAVDPRKQAQRAQNSTMNLLKALGLVYFAKKLPDILGFFNNAEKKLRGWIGEIGDKISGVFTGDDGFITKLKDGLWNSDETGALNKFVKWLSQELYTRKRLADTVTNGLDFSVFSIGDSIKSLIDWMSAFLGGEKAAKAVLNKGREVEIQKGFQLLNQSRDSNVGNIDGKGTSINLGVAGGVELDNKRTNVNYLYEHWANKKGLNERQRTKEWAKKQFLQEEGDSFLTYFGEADILTYRLHNLSNLIQENYGTEGNNMGGTTLTRKDFSLTGNSLASDNRRATLAASLDLYKLLKGSTTISRRIVTPGLDGQPATDKTESRTTQEALPDRIIYLLKLLSEKSTIVVFKKFYDLFSTLATNEDKTVKIKLIREPMEERDRQFYCPKGEYTFSTHYQKIVLQDVTGIPRELTEKDFNGNTNSKEWEVMKISGKTIQNILNALTNNSVDYSADTQRAVINNLQSWGVITEQKANDSRQYITSDKKYDSRINEINTIIREKNEAANQREVQQQTTNTGSYTQSTANSYLDSKKSDVRTDIQSVSYIEKSSEFPTVATEETKRKSPRLSKNIANVTKAFGGTGSLSSNFMEWRENHPRPGNNRYHYGIDLINKAGDEVLFPGYGTIIDSNVVGGSGTYIDVEDDNNKGYITRYWHTKLYGGLKVGSKVLPGQPVGITEATGENGNRWSPHIHVEVHDRDWKEGQNNHDHYINPLVYWKNHKANKKDTKIEANIIAQTDESSTPEIGTTTQTSINNANQGLSKTSSNVVPITSELPNRIISPTSITPSTNISTGYSSNSGSLAMAENITPTGQVNQSPENNNEILLARCADGIDYIAKSMAPLSEVINSGNMMVAETVSKSGGSTNLTPHEPQLEMNQV